jgi:hypothetical protein
MHCIPYTCGDGPSMKWSGYFHSAVFPTPVGMIRGRNPRPRRSSRCPHTCGDGPWFDFGKYFDSLYSLRMWEWTGTYSWVRFRRWVFPTHVGMD